MSHNTPLQKQTFDLNGAGTSNENPILSGVPFDIDIYFNKKSTSVNLKAGQTSPPTNNISLTEVNETLFRHSAIAGNSPFINGKTFIRAEFASNTVWEKFLHIAVLPSDAFQVFDTESQAFVSVPGNVPLCCQMMGVRFFNSWFDEFRIKRFGGCQYVSVFDAGTNEEDDDHVFVRRIFKQKIDEVKYIYLEKHLIQTVENHSFVVRFRTKKDSNTFVDLNCVVQSVSCWGFELKDPVVSE